MKEKQRSDLGDLTRPADTDSDVSGADAAPADDRIAFRAYKRYEERGYQHGRDLEDWLEAERELRDIPPSDVPS